jgi:hypothetical protein
VRLEGRLLVPLQARTILADGVLKLEPLRVRAAEKPPRTFRFFRRGCYGRSGGCASCDASSYRDKAAVGPAGAGRMVPEVGVEDDENGSCQTYDGSARTAAESYALPRAGRVFPHANACSAGPLPGHILLVT